MSVNIWKSYTLRSYKVVVKKKYWGPNGMSTHDHCDTGTALYGNAEVMGSNPERTYIFSGLIFTTIKIALVIVSHCRGFLDQSQSEAIVKEAKNNFGVNC